MAEKLWVKAAHPRASFYQEVLEMDPDGGPAKLVIEHVRAHTDPRTGEQVPVPIHVTDTPEVQRAFLEKIPGTENPARFVRCSAKEIEDHLAKHPEAASAAQAHAAAVAKKAGGSKKASSKKAVKLGAKDIVAAPEE